jgi:hypothetical protein
MSFNFYVSPSFFLGDSSHSLSFAEERFNERPSSGVPLGIDNGPAGEDPTPTVGCILLENSLRKPNALTLTMTMRNASVDIAAGEKVTSRLPKNDDMKSAETKRNGTVTADEKADATVAPRRPTKR